MKLQLCTLLLLLVSSFSIAQKKNIDLIVLSSDGEKFFLILNGVKQNSSAEASVKVSGLSSGTFEAVIAFENNFPDIKDKIYTIWEGTETDNREFTYVIEKKNEKYRMRFLSSNELKTPEEISDEKKDTVQTVEQKEVKCVEAMGNKEFEEAVESIGFKSMEDSRLRFAKEVLQTDCMNTTQLQEVCQMFEYDASRLDFLKFAYDRCVDSKTFDVLVSVFTYKNSRREFEEWIQTKKK